MTTYLCGGINGLSDAGARDWREVAKAQLATSTLDPMRRDYRGREDESVIEIVHGDYADIDASDFVLASIASISRRISSAVGVSESEHETRDVGISDL